MEDDRREEAGDTVLMADALDSSGDSLRLA